MNLAWQYVLTAAVTVLLGMVTLLYGRQRSWYFVALGGFLCVQALAPSALPGWDVLAVFVIALVAGLALAGLSRLAQLPLVALASFLGVGYLALTLCEIAGLTSPWTIFFPVIAGAIAVVSLFIWYDRAIIVSSALAGAVAMAAGTALVFFVAKLLWGGWTMIIQMAVLIFAGIVYQSRELPRSQRVFGTGAGSQRASAD